MLRMCLDKRVLGGLALVAVGVLVVAPNLFIAALPLLLLAICPLSMLFMGRAMMGGGQRHQVDAPQPIDVPYRTVSAPNGDERIAQVQDQLETLREQQAALAHELARLQASPVLPEAHADGREVREESASLPTAGL